MPLGLLQDPPRSEPVTADTVKQLTDVVVQRLGPRKLLTPAMLRGKHATLHAAMKAKGPAFWPTLEAARGKFIVIIAGALADRPASQTVVSRESPCNASADTALPRKIKFRRGLLASMR